MELRDEIVVAELRGGTIAGASEGLQRQEGLIRSSAGDAELGGGQVLPGGVGVAFGDREVAGSERTRRIEQEAG